jgi:hypothetical protein
MLRLLPGQSRARGVASDQGFEMLLLRRRQPARARLRGMPPGHRRRDRGLDVGDGRSIDRLERADLELAWRSVEHADAMETDRIRTVCRTRGEHAAHRQRQVVSRMNLEHVTAAPV